MRINDLRFRAVFVGALGIFFACVSCHGATAQQSPIRPRPIAAGPASFTPDMPFGQALDILRHAVDPPLPMIVLWKDLERNADIDRHTSIGMDGVSGVSLRTHLDLLLLAVSAGNPTRLGYTVRQGVIVIGTQQNLSAPSYTTRVYDITDIVSSRMDSLWRLPWVRTGLMMSLVAPLPPVIVPFQ